MANGSLGYSGRTTAEDRATLGSNPSAAVGPYGTSGILVISKDIARFLPAGGPKAINPHLPSESHAASQAATNLEETQIVLPPGDVRADAQAGAVLQRALPVALVKSVHNRKEQKRCQDEFLRRPKSS